LYCTCHITSPIKWRGISLRPLLGGIKFLRTLSTHVMLFMEFHYGHPNLHHSLDQNSSVEDFHTRAPRMNSWNVLRSTIEPFFFPLKGYLYVYDKKVNLLHKQALSKVVPFDPFLKL
jgi:hypothetical protein